MYVEHQLNLSEWDDRHSWFPCAILCVIIFLILGFLPVIPSKITQLLRPILIAACFLFPTKTSFRFGATEKALMAYLLYFLFVFFAHPITGSSAMAYGAVLLFGLFFLMLVRRTWRRTEIQHILFAVTASCTIFAFVLVRDNPNMLHYHPIGGFTFRGAHINDNSSAYGLTPGVLSGFTLALFHHPRKNNSFTQIVIGRLFLFGCGSLCLYVIFCIGARGAFTSSVLGSIFILFQKTRSLRSKQLRRLSLLFLIMFLVMLIVMGTRVTTGTHSERLFDFRGYSDTNGRDDLAEEAWSMIKKRPLFGGGFDYWDQENGNKLGTHNTFLTIMVRGGYVGALFLAFFLSSMIIEIIRSRNFLVAAFSIEPLFHSLAESDLNYYAYIPMLIAFILLKNSIRYKAPPETLI